MPNTMKFKHIAALLLSLVMLVSCFGCSTKEDTSYALKIKDTPYTAAQVNYEYMAVYQQYSQYAMYFGSALPDDPFTMGDYLDTDEEYATWGDFYLAQTEEKLKQLTSLCDMAAADGVELDDAEKQEIEDWIASLKESAKLMGQEDFNAFVEENFGSEVTEDVLRDMAQRETLAMKYVQYYEDHLTFSQEEIDAAYEADKDSYDTYTFYYYMVEAEPDETGSVSEEALAAAKAQADQILAAAQEGSGEAQDRFNAAIPGGETADIAEMDGSTIAQYEIPFESWLKDASRAAGDMTVSEQPGYGYFVILFDGRERNDSPTVNVRHVLIQAEDTDMDGSISDAEMAAAKTAIEQVKAEWDAGEQTEEAFAALANQYSTDPGSNTNGGLYENVYEGQMVPEFNDFCFNPDRQPGDVEIVADETYSGYHLMYYVGAGESYTNLLIREELTNKAFDEFADSLVNGIEVLHGDAFENIGLSDAYLEKINADYGMTTPTESTQPDAEGE